MHKKTISNTRVLFALILVGIFIFSSSGSSWNSVFAQDIPTDTPTLSSNMGETPEIEVISPYFSIEHRTMADGTQLSGYIINGPPDPPAEYEAERAASIMPLPSRGVIASFPSYDWVFGCSAVSGAMIAAYYDNNAYTNMYSGPTNGGVMPLTDTSWLTWSDGFVTYPNNPLIASHNGVDGRVTKGSIDDYWVQYGSAANDPYITGAWTQHAWSDAIGDYMKTSQSVYSNTDGSTLFYNYATESAKLTCGDMKSYGIYTLDGTYGRKLFYEARGYTVSDCYNQNTDNNVAGGFSLANFQAEIDAGHPVLLNLDGHSIVGYGYSGSTIYIRDTWSSDPTFTPTMTWDGSPEYLGMTLLSVSVVHLAPVVQYQSYLPMVVNDTGVVIPPDPILNGGFESGPGKGWSEGSSNGWIITTLVQSWAHSGIYVAFMGADFSEVSWVSQSITVPYGRSLLYYWYYVDSVYTCGLDYFRIYVDATNPETLDLCTSTDSLGWERGSVDLAVYQGTTITLKFEVTTTPSTMSSFYLDDVSLETTARTVEFAFGERVIPEATRLRR